MGQLDAGSSGAQRLSLAQGHLEADISEDHAAYLASLMSPAQADNSTDPAFERIAALAADLLDAPVALISLVGAERLCFKARIGITPEQTPSDPVFCAHLLGMGAHAVLSVPDAASDPRFLESPLVTGDLGVRFYLGAALTTADGGNIGALCIIDRKPRPAPDARTLERLRSLAAMAVHELELRRAGRVLAQRRQLLDLAAGMTGLGHWRYCLTDSRTTWSPEVYRILGYATDMREPSSEMVLGIYDPLDRIRVIEAVNRTALEGEGFNLKLRITTATGEARVIVLAGKPEFDDLGQIVAVFGVFQDITPHEQALARARLNEQRFRFLAENMGDVVCRIALDGLSSYVSPASEAIIGHPPEALIGRRLAEFVHPEDHDKLAAELQALASGARRKVTLEHRILHRDGRILWAETTIQRAPATDDTPPEMVTVTRDITERKATEAALAQSETLYRQVTELSSDITFRRRLDDPLQRISYVSSAVANLGWLPEDIIGRSYIDFVHPDDHARVGRSIPNILGKRPLPRAEEREFRILKADGSYIWVEANPSIVYDETGRPVEGITVLRDIDERKAAQMALAASEARYRLVTEASRDLIIKYGPDGTIKYASGAARRFGYAPEELVGRNGIEQIHPDDQDFAMRMVLSDFMSDAEPNLDTPREFRVKCADGGWVWVEGAPAILRDANGRPEAVINTLREITGRKEMERALAASEARYRGLCEAAPDMISEGLPDGTITYVSPACEAITGWPPEALIGKNVFDITHPDDRAPMRAAAETVAGGSGGAFMRTLEYRAFHRDGRLIWLESRPAILRDPTSAEPTGFIDVVRDITARKALEAELEAAREAAERAAAVKGDFLANMTHELRTPLNAIVGFSGLLRESPSLSERDAHHVGLIHDASQTLLSVVKDVLDFSKLEADAIDFEQHPFDPVQIAEATLSLLASEASAKGLSLDLSSRGRQGMLLGDSARLRQVILNFVANAIKFTAKGGVGVRLNQTLRPSGEIRLRVEVADTGIGVPPEQQATIFGRFTQADASVSRQYGGTGLGLAICKRIIEGLSGQIGVISEIGKGSTFWFELDMACAGAETVEAAELAEATDGLQPALRLLVVDDNAVNRELICELLKPFDVEVTTAADGVEAVELARTCVFDIILMDVQMPNMDGLTATRRIRAAAGPEAPRTPIIAMTANVLPEQIDRCLEAGMDDHLGKPISPRRLLELLDQWSQPEALGGSQAA